MVRKRTLSDGREWDGFRPVAYTLDLERVWKLRIELDASRSDGGDESSPSITLGKALTQLRAEGIKQTAYETGHLTVRTHAGEHSFGGPAFSRELLEVLLRLETFGVDGFRARWYYYDSDSVRDMPQDSYDFFIVSGDKIIDQCVSFSDHDYAGFDPAVFSASRVGIWRREDDKAEAVARFWYRKFYTETKEGQLMVLRPDEPELYHYPEGRWQSFLPVKGWEFFLVAAGRLDIRLRNIYYLLVTLAILGVLGFVLMRW